MLLSPSNRIFLRVSNKRIAILYAGAVPEFAMPATPSLTGSKMLNRQLSAEVRRGQRQLRRLAERGHTDVGPYREVIGQTMTVLRR